MVEVSFGEWLKRRRKARGLTQEQLAEEIHCSASALRKIEAEQRRPSAQIVEGLAAAFNIASNERKSFLKFARGNWDVAPTGIIESAPWRVSPASENELEELSNPKTHLATFLFTDIEGSAKFWESDPEKMKIALQRHHQILQEAISSHGGDAFQIVGDAFCVVFPTASSAISAAVTAQCKLYQEQWNLPSPIRVRMGIHTGTAERTSDDSPTGGYTSNHTLNRVSRILSAGHGEQILLSLATKELVKDSLPADIELRDMGEHHLKNLNHPEHLFQLNSAGLPSDFPPLNTLDSTRHNLPAQLSSFIGRAREIAEIKELLSLNRLVTLTGPGGCGKTRLALKVAHEELDEFEDGVWLIELASLAEPSLVPQTVASVLDIHEQSGRALIDILVDYLLSRHVLLVIDNCEHLITACAQFTETLLQKCPNLKILATSREALGITGEIVWTVPPLSLPDSKPWTNPASTAEAVRSYEESESIQLFVVRAADSSSDFRLTTDNGAWVAEICRRLDGMPLAIELAAARVRSLSVQEIAQRLDDRFHLLTGGSRTALPRQQTLEATLDWSYNLLSDTERKVLNRLSVFAGGATLDAIEAVCSSEGIEEDEVLDILSHLVDKTLIVADQGLAETRYRMLETIRQYAHERLLDSDEWTRVRNRHLDFFLKYAEEAEAKLEGAEQVTQLESLEREHDNLRAALASALKSQVEMSEPTNVESGMRLAGALTWFWLKHSHWSEGRNWLGQFLANDRDVSPSALAKALFGAGLLADFQNDSQLALTLYERSLTLYKDTDDKRGIGNTLNYMSEHLLDLGEYERAVALSEQSLDLNRHIGYKPGIADALHGLGELTYVQGDFRRARQFLEDSLALAHEISDKWRIGIELKFLSFVAIEEGEFELASELAGEALALHRELGDKRQTGSSLYALAYAVHGKGDNTSARALLKEAVSLVHEVRDKVYTTRCLEAFAGLAVTDGQHEQAARLFGAAERIRQTLNNPVLLQRAAYERNVAAVRARMSKTAFEKAWSEGHAMTLEQAVDFVLHEPESPLLARTAKEQFGDLTAREREVAILIAQGKSNREIATAMTVGVKTVETYVTRILNKLGFDSRVHIATWAIEKGLR